MKHLVWLLLLSACTTATPPTAEPYCKRLPFDAGDPPGLAGTYRIIGMEAGTTQAYSGALAIAAVKNTYILSRTINGQTLKGEAWLESCGPDRLQVLRARYDSRPKVTELYCYLRYDPDAYTRSSCTASEDGGLEAWYQVP
jgi:hypothetical protein